MVRYAAARFTEPGSPDPMGAFATAADRAAFRGEGGDFLGWNGKFQFSAPTAGAGTLELTRLWDENRRMADETWCSDCGVFPGFTPPAGTILYDYALADDGTFTIVDSKRVIQGAFSADLSTVVALNVENETNLELLVGVRVPSSAPTLTGLYAIANEELTVTYPTSGTTTQARWFHEALGFGWVNFAPATETPDLMVFDNHHEMWNPAALLGDGYSSATSTANVVGEGLLPESVALGADGTGILSVGGDAPVALVGSVGGHVAIWAGDTSALDRSSDPSEVKYRQNFGVLLRQGSPGSLSAADVAGTWAMAMRDSQRVDGSGDSVERKTGTFAMLTLEEDGTFSVTMDRHDDLGNVTLLEQAGTFAVNPRCIGATDGTPASRLGDLSISECLAAGGQALDVAALSAIEDAATKVVAWITFADDGQVASVMSPAAFDPDTSAARTTGFLVRLR